MPSLKGLNNQTFRESTHRLNHGVDGSCPFKARDESRLRGRLRTDCFRVPELKYLPHQDQAVRSARPRTADEKGPAISGACFHAPHSATMSRCESYLHGSLTFTRCHVGVGTRLETRHLPQPGSVTMEQRSQSPRSTSRVSRPVTRAARCSSSVASAGKTIRFPTAAHSSLRFIISVGSNITLALLRRGRFGHIL